MALFPLDQTGPGGGHTSPGQLFKQVPFSISLAITPNRQFGRGGQFLRVTLSIFAVAGNVHFFAGSLPWVRQIARHQTGLPYVSCVWHKKMLKTQELLQCFGITVQNCFCCSHQFLCSELFVCIFSHKNLTNDPGFHFECTFCRSRYPLMTA